MKGWMGFEEAYVLFCKWFAFHGASSSYIVYILSDIF